MTLAFISVLFSWGLAIFINVRGTLAVLWSYRSDGKVPFRATELPPVSILKPLKGLDAGLEENLDSFFHLDYPRFELLFLMEPGDPSVRLVTRLISRYPKIDTRLIVSGNFVGPNPKINNLMRGYKQANYDAIWISDSNVRVDPETLRLVIAHDKPGVGVITAVIAGTNGTGLGGRLECAFLNSFYARWMYLSGVLGCPFVVGKLMFFRRSVMNRLGGIATLGRYIAEDYMAGQAVRRMGLKISILEIPVRQYIGRLSLSAFWSRHIRWGRIRKAQTPLAFVIEPVFGSVLSGLLGALALSRLSDVPCVMIFFLHMTLWFVADLLIMLRMEKRFSLLTPVIWLCREFLALPLWVSIAAGSSVMWRGNRFKILPGGLLEVRA